MRGAGSQRLPWVSWTELSQHLLPAGLTEAPTESHTSQRMEWRLRDLSHRAMATYVVSGRGRTQTQAKPTLQCHLPHAGPALRHQSVVQCAGALPRIRRDPGLVLSQSNQEVPNIMFTAVMIVTP